MAEQILAADGQRQRIGVEGKLEKLLRPLRFKQRRVWCAIGEYQPIKAELSIVRRIAKVAAVSPVFLTVFITASERLIDPIPNEAPL